MKMRFSGIMPQGIEKLFVRDDLRSVMAEFGSYTAHAFDGGADHTAELIPLLRETDVALTAWSSPRLPLDILRDKPRRLKYVCNVSGGLKGWIPREYIEAGILVTNWGDGPMWYLAEGNLTLILACTREMPRLRRHMLEQPTWLYNYASPYPTLRRKTVGFMGFGAVGRLLLGLLAPFEVKAIAYDPYVAALPEPVARCGTLEELFEQSDVLTIQAGLTEETTGLVGRALLDRLKRNAIFINTARGKIVREKELIEFLRARPDVFAGLDVFEQEPTPKDSPLLQMDNVICYPHSICEVGEAMFAESASYAAANIRAFCTGKPVVAQITAEKYGRMT
ncbi:MAG: NAD(P)-dependent oxidoreductase [Candidatus Brocadiia bacterium]